MLSLSPFTCVPAKALYAQRKPSVTSQYVSMITCGRSHAVRGRLLASDGSRTQSIIVRDSKDDLEKQLDLTQNTLDRVLAAVQAAQASQQQAACAAMPQENMLAAREQQLWDRQQALLDRMQQQLEQERQAWLGREAMLLSELAALRQELLQVMKAQQQQQQQGDVAAAAVGPGLSSYTGSNSFGVTATSSSVQAKISGPSPASAAVAEAIRAVRDQHVNPPVSTSSPSAPTPADTDEDTSLGPVSTWQELFPGALKAPVDSTAADSVAAAMSAVDTTDILGDMDLSYGSSRGRRRVDISSSNGSSSNSTLTAAAAAESSSNSDDEADTGSSSGSSATPAEAAAAVEVPKGDPSGPPPVLTLGDDDIFWVAKLHDGLVSAGFYPSEDELENWMFAEGTMSALLTFQACNDVPETGTTCEATWRKLMGKYEYEAAYGHLTASSSSSSSSNGTGAVSAAVTEASEEVITFTFPSPDFSGGNSSSGSNSSGSGSSSSSSSSGRVTKAGWPVVMDTDGGKEVHALQVCLCKAGFNCGDDEMRWWQFGSSTMDALKTFQACNGLPESGVCDERTWLALLGGEAKPEDLQDIRGDESMYEDDMAAPHEGAVWLLGEQRWSKPAS